MTVSVNGLPANTDFDFFVIQVPNKPFGMSWYQGDIETNGKGNGRGIFIGRFSIETFVVAPGVADAPLTFDNAFPSVSPNPATGPIQMYHLGLWFNSPTDANNAGCGNATTPFNGEHNAGVQLLNTSNFPDLQGPLINVHESIEIPASPSGRGTSSQSRQTWFVNTCAGKKTVTILIRNRKPPEKALEVPPL
jgi:hypothetical protein